MDMMTEAERRFTEDVLQADGEIAEDFANAKRPGIGAVLVHQARLDAAAAFTALLTIDPTKAGEIMVLQGRISRYFDIVNWMRGVLGMVDEIQKHVNEEDVRYAQDIVMDREPIPADYTGED